ncbi:MAG: Asp-tRNA(Asn)/Glu-tRNA(Gln) amidotransferase subunit GatB [Bacteroidota bacterium]
MSHCKDKYEAVIGLEVHAQMLTESKAFCACTTHFGSEPNHNVCPVCLGMPGVLPILNLRLVEFVIRMGLATQCTIAMRSIFARKNYFYPDLPKGYQISQYEEPICTGGFVEVDLDVGTRKRIGITRIHMEEDAGKLIHDLDVDTLVDVNRCGVPLIEIVSEPDIRFPREAYLYLYKIRQLVRYLGVCDGNMEEGSLRCDANVSVRLKGDAKFGTKTEVKNMNSFRNVERALEFEIERQIQILEEGGTVVQETLLWDANLNVATPMRTKEFAHDYRYFPEPDLVPIVVEKEWIEQLRGSLPELPMARRDRFVREYGLPRYDADVLTTEKGVADYYEEVVRGLTRKDAETSKQTSNWVMTDVLRVIGEKKIAILEFPIPSSYVSKMINLINDGTISGKIAKEVFEEMLNNPQPPDRIVKEKGLVQLSDSAEIEKVVVKVLEDNKDQVEKYLSGKDKVLGFFVGKTMKATGGKANPKVVNEILKRRLDSLKKT